MSHLTVEQLVTRIHDAPARIALAITGGGTGAIAALLETPGGSRTLLEAVVPYSSAALDDWLGATPDHYCSDRTARAMAIAAFERARRLASSGAQARPAVEQARGLAGVGCTASLASDRPKRGDHRIHAAFQTLERTVVETLVLTKGRRDRAAEERLAAHMVLNLIAEACGLDERLDLGLSAPERIERAECRAPEAWQRLLAGEIGSIAVDVRAPASTTPAIARSEQAATSTRGIFPGAFNPRHAAHVAMAAVAERRLGAPVEYEISIANVDKPPLDYIEIDQRVRQFAANERLWLTAAPTFERKSRLFPGCTFVVGADTALRIAEAKYYGHDVAARDAALAHIASRGCRFLVFGRTVNGRFQPAESLDLPPAMRAMCDFVGEAEFRQDLSSTELRRASEASGA